MDYAQQQSQKIKKEAQQTPNTLTETQNNSQKTGLCPKCNTELPEIAIFCPECGNSTGPQCPKCAAPAASAADICEVCGEWLLEDQCKFCYAEFPDGALFCPECGKPKEGINCPNCGKLNIFDFCSDCGKPVTEEAVAELEHAKDEIDKISSNEQETTQKTFTTSQEARRYYNACAIAEKTGIEAELAKLDALINNVPEPVISIENEPPASTPAPPKRKSLFSDKQLASIKKTGAAVEEVKRQRLEEERIAEEKRKEEERIAEEKRKAEEAERRRKEEERKRQEEERQRLIREKEELERRLRNRKWLCNIANVLHNSPNECCVAYGGGHWVS